MICRQIALIVLIYVIQHLILRSNHRSIKKPYLLSSDLTAVRNHLFLSLSSLLPSVSSYTLVQEDGMERSEEHTSELQSRGHLVCRLLLEKKNKKTRHRA